jgi:hypothetical protein
VIVRRPKDWYEANHNFAFGVDGGVDSVNGHFAIRHPKLPSSADEKNRNGKVILDIDKQDKQAAKWLDTQPDDSFEPTHLNSRAQLLHP